MRRVFGVAGVAGSAVATVANLGCCGAGFVVPAGLIAPAAAFAVVGRWGYPILYVSLVATLAVLASGIQRHRSWLPTLVALGGASLLLAAFHDAWDVRVFAGMVWSGLAGLLVAVAADGRARHRACVRPS